MGKLQVAGLFLSVFFFFLFISQSVEGKKRCSHTACGSTSCARGRTLCLIREGKGRLAVELLKKEKDSFGGSKQWSLLMASSYMSVGNDFWAINVLSDYLEQHPDDCEAISWLVWIHLKGGNLDEAEALIKKTNCIERSGDERVRSRFALLDTFLEIQKAKKANETDFSIRDKKVKKVYPEDLSLYRYNKSVLHPRRSNPLVLKFEMVSGYATNAMMGSPSDPIYEEGTEMASPLVNSDVWINFIPPLWRWLVPSFEVLGRGIFFTRKNTEVKNYPRQYSYYDIGYRPGVVINHEGLPRFVVAYHGDFLLLNKPTKYTKDTPLLFYEGHRAEVEAEVLPHLTLFAGAGRRVFDEKVRSRWEFDWGVGGTMGFTGRIHLLGAISMRKFIADNKGYNLFGATGVLSISFSLWKGFRIKNITSLGMDNYLDSMGYFGSSEEKKRVRKDTSIKTRLEVLTPSYYGLRGKVGCEFSLKLSTISVYEYMDYRIVGGLVWNWSFDLWQPRKKGSRDHIPIDYGIGAGPGGEVEEKIQDLIRQDESVRSGSSCRE